MLACARAHTHSPLHIPTDAKDKEDVFPLHPHVCPWLRQRGNALWRLPAKRGQESARWRRAWSTERCRRHRHTRCDTCGHKHACTRTHRARKHTCAGAGAYVRTHTQTHTQLQGLREWVRELERVGCYLFISLSCSQEATSPRSCKHTETRASVSSNPGNNKWSPHSSVHTHTWDACTNTYTHVGCQCPDSKDKTTSLLGQKEDKSRLQCKTGFQRIYPTYVNHRYHITKEQQTWFSSMINWFLYFHTYFGWILIESGGQDGIGGKDGQGNNQGLKGKKEKKCAEGMGSGIPV